MIQKIAHSEIRMSKPSVQEVMKYERCPIYILCENIRSLHNVGAILRTADGILAAKVFLCGISGFPPRKEISKTALGAEDTVPWQYHRNTVKLAKNLKEDGVQLVALELTHQSVCYTDAVYDFPVCLVVGNEIDGISDELLDFCDLAVKIPMLGRANSLNVATACGIAGYEILRQYGKRIKK